MASANRWVAYRKSFLTIKQALDLKVIVPGLLTVLVAVLAIPSRVITASSYDGHSSLAAFFPPSRQTSRASSGLAPHRSVAQ